MRNSAQNHRSVLWSFVVLLHLLGALLPCDGQNATVAVPANAAIKARLPVCQGILPNLSFTAAKNGPDVKLVTTSAGLFDAQRKITVPAAIDLLAQLKELVSTDFSRTAYEGRGWVTNLGDILLRFQASQSGPGSTGRFWSIMQSNAPSMYTKIYPILSALTDQGGFSHFGTTPWGMNDFRDDGFLHGKSGKSSEGKEFAQIASLIFFRDGVAHRFPDGCEAIQFMKRQDLDLANYPKRTGLDSPYRSAKLKDNRVVRAKNSKFLVYMIENVVDISRKPKRAVVSDSMEIETHIMESFDQDGYWRSDYYGKGTVGVLWVGSSTQLEFEGNDTYIPIYASDGRFVAVLMVTSVAAKGENPLLIIRENMGSLKSRAELLWRRMPNDKK